MIFKYDDIKNDYLTDLFCRILEKRAFILTLRHFSYFAIISLTHILFGKGILLINFIYTAMMNVLQSDIVVNFVRNCPGKLIIMQNVHILISCMQYVITIFKLRYKA